MQELMSADFNYDDFSLSFSAIIASPKFEGKDFKCFVEGKDDKIFWEKILLKDKAERFDIQVLDGVKNIENVKELKMLDSILTTDMKKEVKKDDFCFLLDKDYRKILENNLPEEYNVIYTCGYSIENTLSCPLNAFEIVTDYLKITKREIQIRQKIKNDIEKYYNKIYNLKKLVAIEIKNQEKCLKSIRNQEEYESFECIPNKIGRLVNIKDDLNILESKKNEILKNAESRFLSKEILEYEKKIDNILMYLKGHFYGSYYTQLILKLVNKYKKELEVDTKNINKEAIYQLSLEKCVNCKCENCIQKKYYEKKRKELFKKLKIKD